MRGSVSSALSSCAPRNKARDHSKVSRVVFGRLSLCGVVDAADLHSHFLHFFVYVCSTRHCFFFFFHFLFVARVFRHVQCFCMFFPQFVVRLMCFFMFPSVSLWRAFFSSTWHDGVRLKSIAKCFCGTFFFVFRDFKSHTKMEVKPAELMLRPSRNPHDQTHTGNVIDFAEVTLYESY